MDCHQSGGIAQKSNQSTLRAGGHEKRRVLVGDVAGAAPQQKSYASDYSFLFRDRHQSLMDHERSPAR